VGGPLLFCFQDQNSIFDRTMTQKLLIENIGQLITCAGGRKGPVAGEFEKALDVRKGGCLAVEGGRVVAVGERERVVRQLSPGDFESVDAEGGLVTPGLVDCHTHPVFVGDRKEEFELSNQGASYEAIARRGGGIFSTVRATRQASTEELEKLFRQRLTLFLAGGTTTLEAKSGYGLSYEDELKILEIIRQASGRQPVELVPTFLGAHTVPPEFKNKRKDYVWLLTERLLPEVASRRLALFCDVFVEKIAFRYAEAKEILLAGKKRGLLPKLHADQLTNGSGGKLAAEVEAVSADHLEHLSPSGVKALKKSGTMAVLLPSAAFYLRSPKAPPVKKLLTANVPIALATDFNPGTSPNYSLVFTMTLACVEWGFSAAQALLAVCRNASFALGKGEVLGQLAKRKQADLVIWGAQDYRELSYYTGAQLARTVVKKGRVVWKS